MHRSGSHLPSPSAVVRFFVVGCVALFCLLGVGGCAGSRPALPVPEIPGYLGPVGRILGRDFSPLRGRRIVLDPGHGGFFQGAVGTGGLTEAQVNLGVALHLRGMLEWAGAEVFMTRTADHDLLTPADSTLSADLAARVALTDSLRPEVFLSIHHNSNAALDRTLNETQTYYPMDAEGAARDLARCIHRQLALTLGIRPAKILPGNFHVLRNASVPAVLGEPAMISHPVIEGRLSFAASQQLEAEAYFLGLLDYFAAGLPTWSGADVDTVIAGPELRASGLRWVFRDGGDGAPGPDPSSFAVTVDGRPAGWDLDRGGRAVSWRLAGAAPRGPIVVSIAGRNLAGRATPERRTLVLPADAASVDLRILSDVEGARAIAWSSGGGATLPAGRFLPADGDPLDCAGGRRGWALLDGGSGTGWSTGAAVYETVDGRRLACRAASDSLPAPWRWRWIAGFQAAPNRAAENSSPAATRAFVRRRGAGSRPPAAAFALGPQAPLVAVAAGAPVWFEAPGLLPLVDADPASAVAPRTVQGADRRWIGRSLLPGLAGKTVVLDAAGGGGDPDGSGPLGLQGAAVNLETVRQAAAFLRAVGADVHLTRTGDASLSPVEKVRLAGAVEADAFLTVRRHVQAGPLLVRHHPGSVVGGRWAVFAAAAMAMLPVGVDSVDVAAGWEYLLRHTACPALDVAFPAATDAVRESLMADPAWSRAEARAILRGLAALTADRSSGLSFVAPDSLIRMVPGAVASDAIDYAIFDGALVWTPSKGPRPATLAPTPGPIAGASDSVTSSRDPGWPVQGRHHTLELHAGRHWQLWLLEFDPVRPSWRLAFDNP